MISNKNDFLNWDVSNCDMWVVSNYEHMKVLQISTNITTVNIADRYNNIEVVYICLCTNGTIKLVPYKEIQAVYNPNNFSMFGNK